MRSSPNHCLQKVFLPAGFMESTWSSRVICKLVVECAPIRFILYHQEVYLEMVALDASYLKDNDPESRLLNSKEILYVPALPPSPALEGDTDKLQKADKEKML